MRLTTKVLIWAWGVLFLILGSLIYSAYSKLNPDSLVSLLNTQIQRSYPGSNLTIAKIDYGFSLDFKLSLKTLTLTKSQKTIASANEVQLRVPWWLILFNRGNASVNISDLVIFVSSDAVQIVPQVATSLPKPIKGTPSIQLSLPAYLVDAHYTLRAKNISIKEIDGDRRFFTLSKLLVREFQYGKNSAFELNIPISITHKDKRYSSDLWLFGDVTPELNQWTLNYRGEFKTKETVEGLRFDDLVIDGKSVFDPANVDLTSMIDISIDRKKVGMGQVTAKYDQVRFQMKFSDFPMDFLNLIGDEIKNPFWKKIEGNGEGEVKFSRSFSDNSSSSLSAKVHFLGDFTLAPDENIKGQWHLNFENEKWKTSFISTNQELKFERRAFIDFSQSRITQYHQEINFSSFDLKTAMLAVEPFNQAITDPDKTEHTSVVLLNDCLDGERIVNGSFRFGLTPSQKYYQAELKEQDSKFSFSYVMKQNHQLIAESTNFKWHPSYQFLAPFFSATEGIINGKMQGQWSSSWSDGKWLLKLNAVEMKNAMGDLLDFNQRAWDHFSLDTSVIPNKSWQMSAENNTIRINPFILNDVDPAQMSGILSTNPKTKSYLTLTYPKNKKWKPVTKDVTEVFWKKETP